MRLAMLLALLQMLPAAVLSSPFSWASVRDMSYTFCYNASGPYNAQALRQLARSRLFIHGMNERQEQPPRYQKSEEKVIASARQLLAANPAQQQFYTIQFGWTRAIYDRRALR